MRFPDDPLYQLLRQGKVDDFNNKRPDGPIDFHDCDLRGLDLRGLDARAINFSGCYFRTTDLRGIDFSSAQMDGASMASAQISGCLFPDTIDANEIWLSVEKGTRMRSRR